MSALIIRLLLSTVVVSILGLAILMAKKLFARHLSKQMHYKLWYILAIPPIAAWIPWNPFQSGLIQSFWNHLSFYETDSADIAGITAGPAGSTLQHTQLLQDFSISVSKPSGLVYSILLTAWFLGMAILLTKAVYAVIQVVQLKRSAMPIMEKEVQNLLQECMKTVGIKREIQVLESPLITSPVTFGILKPCIVLPERTWSAFSAKELQYIFLHELCHHKNKDVLVNQFIWVYQMLYWFNPFIWITLKQIHTDREIACDDAVLGHLDADGHLDYGYILIRFAEKGHAGMYGNMVPGIAGSRKQMKQRIQNIADYSHAEPQLKRKSRMICTVFLTVAILMTAVTGAVASTDDVFSFSGRHAVYEDLSPYFTGYDGSFVLFDEEHAQYTIYNRKESQQRTSPDSTYKIYSALFALESGALTADSTQQGWDGKHYPYSEWNRDQTLQSAMRDSVNWYFQKLDEKTGRKQLETYFHKMKYGNKNLSGNLEDYWLESTLKISPIEQVQLLRGMDQNVYGFKEENIETVKQAMLMDEQDGRLYGKTGTGTINGKDEKGWFVGLIERDGHSYYFAINLQSDKQQADGRKALEIAKQILHDKNLYKANR